MTNNGKAGLAFGRWCATMAACASHPEKARQFAKDQGWSEIEAALRTNHFDAGGAWVPENFVPEVIELLRPASAVRSLRPRYVDLSGGTATLPKLTGGATAYYKGEAQRGTKSEGTSGAVTLIAKELMVFVPISNQLLQRTSGSAGEIMRDDSVAAISARSDLAFIRGDGTQDAPKGLRYLAAAANVITANATVNLANVTTDLGIIVLALENADVGMTRPGWIMPPRTKTYLMSVRDGNGNYAFRAEMLQGMLQGYPFAVTTQIPTNLGAGSDESELYFADFADVLLGEEERLQVSVFDQVTYYDGTQWVSSAQNNEVVLRVVHQHDIGVRNAESVAVLTGVKWGA